MTAAHKTNANTRAARLHTMAAALAVIAVLGAFAGWQSRGNTADAPSAAPSESTAPPQSTVPAVRYVVAIDAGHGGSDTGARGLVDEVEVIQPTTDALMALLEADPAYTPVLIHSPEEQPKPQQRAEAAAEAGAQLFLSLHANKDTHASSHGFECYAVPPGRPWHDESLALARDICIRMGQAGARVRGDDGVRYAYYRNKSKLMKESTDTAEYGYPTFGVLQNASCPAVLIEQCFITNTEDLDAWGDADGCKAAAACYYEAICAYFGTQPVSSSHGN